MKLEIIFLSLLVSCCYSTTVFNGTASKNTSNCYQDRKYEKVAPFVTTTEAVISTEASVTSTTEKQLSIGANIHVFLLKVIGKGEVFERAALRVSTTSTAPPEEATTKRAPTTTEPTFDWMVEDLTFHPNGSEKINLIPITQSFARILLNINAVGGNGQEKLRKVPRTTKAPKTNCYTETTDET